MGNHRPTNEMQQLAEYEKVPVHNVPFFFQVNHIHSAFVEVREGRERGRENRVRGRREGISVLFPTGC